MNLNVLAIVRVLKIKNYVVFEQDHKNFNINIIGIRTNDTNSNSFNDHMCLLWKYMGYWNTMIFPITTDPGHYWRENPMNVKGTAILNSTRVDKWSAGCQVQPTESIFKIEMNIFKQAAENWGNSFTYTLLEESDFD